MYAIIPAAGQGLRFGGTGKQFQSLKGRPLLRYAVGVFASVPSIRGIVIVVPAAEVSQVAEDFSDLKKRVCVVPGGKTRQESVQHGFASLAPCHLVVVHDGVRPLVTRALIERVVTEAEAYGAALCALPLHETIKQVDDEGWIHQTVDRSMLWSVQTPQAFHYDLFKRALELAAREGYHGTDEAMLVEKLGEKIKVVKGDPFNIKITTREDLMVAEKYLELR